MENNFAGLEAQEKEARTKVSRLEIQLREDIRYVFVFLFHLLHKFMKCERQKNCVVFLLDM